MSGPVRCPLWDFGDTLCGVALARMPGDIDRSEALLIDNKEVNVEGWRRRGGRGYLYRDDATFAADLASGTLFA